MPAATSPTPDPAPAAPQDHVVEEIDLDVDLVVPAGAISSMKFPTLEGAHRLHRHVGPFFVDRVLDFGDWMGNACNSRTTQIAATK